MPRAQVMPNALRSLGVAVTRKLILSSRSMILWLLRLLLVLGLLLVPQFVLPHKALAATTASDNFNRADGGLGPNWTPVADGGMAIASQQVAGPAGATTGDMWTANTFGSDQFSAVQVTSTQLSGGSGSGRRCGCRTTGRTATWASTSGTTAAPS